MSSLGTSPSPKVEVMCEGIRYPQALVAALPHSMPNFYPYRFKKGEAISTGKDTIATELEGAEDLCSRGLAIWDGFICHRCAYMQIECDVDRAPEWQAA